MLSTQVEYWKLQESKRHSLQDEAIRREANEIGWANASANLTTAQANVRNADSNARNAATNEKNAEINAFNAAVNLENAKSNRINAQAADLRAQGTVLSAQASWVNAMSTAKLATYQTEGLGALLDKTKILNIASETDLNRTTKQLRESQIAETDQSKALKKAQTDTENATRNAKVLDLVTGATTTITQGSRNVADTYRTYEITQPDVEYTRSKTKTESTQRFKNITSGIRDIGATIHDLSDSANAWYNSFKSKKGGTSK